MSKLKKKGESKDVYNFDGNIVKLSRTQNLDEMPKEWRFIINASVEKEKFKKDLDENEKFTCICNRKIIHADVYMNIITGYTIYIGSGCREHLKMKCESNGNHIIHDVVHMALSIGEYKNIYDLVSYSLDIRDMFKKYIIDHMNSYNNIIDLQKLYDTVKEFIDSSNIRDEEVYKHYISHLDLIKEKINLIKKENEERRIRQEEQRKCEEEEKRLREKEEERLREEEIKREEEQEKLREEEKKREEEERKREEEKETKAREIRMKIYEEKRKKRELEEETQRQQEKEKTEEEERKAKEETENRILKIKDQKKEEYKNYIKEKQERDRLIAENLKDICKKCNNTYCRICKCSEPKFDKDGFCDQCNRWKVRRC